MGKMQCGSLLGSLELWPEQYVLTVLIPQSCLEAVPSYLFSKENFNQLDLKYVIYVLFLH